MIKKYKIDFEDRKSANFKAYLNKLNSVKIFFSDFYSNKFNLFNFHKKNNLSFSPKWNHIRKKTTIDKLFHKYIHLPHLNKKLMVYSITTLFIFATFLFNFYITIQSDDIGYAKEFNFKAEKTQIVQFNSTKSTASNPDPIEDTEIREKVLYAGTGRLYFQNENNSIVDFDDKLKTNLNFNSNIYSGQEDIKITWDQLYDNDVNLINAKQCLFFVYPYNDNILIDSESSSFKSSSCEYTLKASDQINYNSFNVQVLMIDLYGQRYSNDKILILK